MVSIRIMSGRLSAEDRDAAVTCRSYDELSRRNSIAGLLSKVRPVDVKRLGFEAKLRTLKRDSAEFFREFEHNQTLDPVDLDRLTTSRSLGIARFAAANSGFYRDLYRERGVDVMRIDEGGWGELPVVTRSMLKEDLDRVPTEEAVPSNVRPALTGGSTGEPLKVLHDTRVPLLGLSWRMYRWWGIEPWDNLARVARWGFGRVDTIKNSLSWWPTRHAYLDASYISEETMQAFHRQLLRVRPKLLEGYVGSLLEFARFVQDNRLPLPKLVAVATTAAPLTENSRQVLQNVFGAPVFDEYRGSEFGWMAGECRFQDGLHLFADVRRFEVLDDDGKVLPPGETGNLVITDLTNRVFPLIRYSIGDRGTLRAGACPCGVSLPIMAKPDGRTTDVLRLPSGAVLNHRLMGMFSADSGAVKMFQIHQRDDYSIDLNVVLGRDSESARVFVEGAAQSLRDRILGEVPIRVSYRDELPYTGAKIKYVISDVVGESAPTADG